MAFPLISIIGSGNLAQHLSRNFENCGLRIVELYGRNLQKAKAITSKLYDARVTSDLDFSDSEASLFFLCVSDKAIADIADELVLPKGSVLVHCSGATPLEAIARDGAAYGVFYPLQTFTASRKVSFEGLPVCLEASTDEAELLLEKIAIKLRALPYFMSSEQRLCLHLSAVFACNFTNHFYRISKDILQDQGLPFQLLKHLIEETARKTFDLGPENAQTGPALRSDNATMQKHLSLLGNHEEWKELYQKISSDIQAKNYQV